MYRDLNIIMLSIVLLLLLSDTPETVNATNATESETESDQEPKKKKKKKSKEKQEAPKGNLVKVNLTAEINVLDLKPMSDAYKQASVDK